MIKAQGLRKDFKIYRKQPGFVGSLKSLFYRSYETKNAVKPFDVEIERGQMVGLLGPNGAGKTTLMKMFTGIIVPSAGNLLVMGHTPFKRERIFQKRIALVMGQKSQLWWDLPAMDSFQLLRRYYEIEENQFKIRVAELSHLLEVEDILKVHVRKLSLGERMKVELMSCLLHQPEMIFLDEPTIGLDLIAQKNIRDFLIYYHQQNHATIILTSHYMADIEALCSRLILLIGGKKRFDDSIKKFDGILGHNKMVSFSFTNPVSQSVPFISPFNPKWNPKRTKVELSIPEEKLRELSQKILRELPVSDFNTEKMPIERVMKSLLENPHLLKD
ncbi:MAG: ATP-binding cassette domain-containing protein [Deltaproteobacteria bacterium]|nr:ATP-binding cassette domain-containing protein [Deltaproteobacteria bacterium]